MSRDKNFPESAQSEPIEAEDVEILEVVGVEQTSREDVESISPEERGDDDEPDEFLLGFEDDDETEEETAGEAEDGRPAATAPETSEKPDGEALARLRADYDNLRKRVARERADFELHANSVLVSRLLPVLDNLERAMAADSCPEEQDAMREGLVMIHRQLSDELSREGLRAIMAVGEVFDPNLHDAVATDPSSDKPANTIIEEFQRGYLFHNKVLRHAMVRVSTNESVNAAVDDGEVVS